MSRACKTCPYRVSAPIGVWDKVEYDRLQRSDQELMGAMFGCHLDDGSLCRGWVADQKKRGIPSIRLRIALSRNAKTLAEVEAVDETDPDLYGSIAEMVEVNRDSCFPEESLAARKLRALKKKQLKKKKGARS